MAHRMLAALIVLVVAILVAGALGSAEAADRPVRFDGRVQWIAGQVMVVQLDTGRSVGVDLVRVPQDEYALLTPNERIVVIGVVTDGSRHVLGRSLVRGDDLQAP